MLHRLVGGPLMGVLSEVHVVTETQWFFQCPFWSSSPTFSFLSSHPVMRSLLRNSFYWREMGASNLKLMVSHSVLSLSTSFVRGSCCHCWWKPSLLQWPPPLPGEYWLLELILPTSRPASLPSDGMPRFPSHWPDHHKFSISLVCAHGLHCPFSPHLLTTAPWGWDSLADSLGSKAPSRSHLPSFWSTCK